VPSSTLDRRIFSRLNRHDFAAFTFEALRLRYNDLAKLDTAEDIYYRQGRVDSPLPEGSYWVPYDAVYINHFSPTELFKQSSVKLDEAQLSDDLDKIQRHYSSPSSTHYRYVGEIYLLLNTVESAIEDFAADVAPLFKRLAVKAGFNVETYGVGTFASFLSYRPEETTQALAQLIMRPSEGLSINVGDDKVDVRPFWSEKPMFCGVTQDSLSPCETVYLSTKRQDAAALEELGALLYRGAKESELERFFVAHYRDIIGYKYDRIETQLWLRFPKLEITGSDRCLDVFVRNSVRRDWELFELKRAKPIISSSGNLPVFIRDVHDAIEQVRNYARLLKESAVKDRLAKEGIEYYEPSLNVVIGRTPQLEHAQWRRLVSNNVVNLFTWDDFYEELRSRHQDRESILKLAMPNLP
jgi:hypothetical protein